MKDSMVASLKSSTVFRHSKQTINTDIQSVSDMSNQSLSLIPQSEIYIMLANISDKLGMIKYYAYIVKCFLSVKFFERFYFPTGKSHFFEKPEDSEKLPSRSGRFYTFSKVKLELHFLFMLILENLMFNF